MPSGEQRRLVIFGCILGVLVAVFAAKTFLLHDGGDSSSSGTTTSVFAPRPFKHHTSTTRAAKGSAAASAKRPVSASKTVARAATTTTADTAPPPTFQVYATKNPFEPVVQIGTGGSGGSGGGSTTTTPSGGGGGSSTTTTVPSNEPPPGQTVTLLSVFRDSKGTVKARVQVGSTVYTVGQGQTFASGQYRVVSLDPPCGQFLFGDSPFRLCEGEQTIK